jgi:hypothetical protein
MHLAQGFRGAMIARMGGALVVLIVVLGAALVIYAVYWMIFKMGKG